MSATLTSFLTNSATQLGLLLDIVGVVCYVAGIWMIASGLLGAAKTGGGRGESWGKVLSLIVAGVLLIAIPQTVDTAVGSVTGQSSPGSVYGYSMPGSSNMPAGSQQAIQAVLAWVQFIGIIAIVRSVFLIPKAASGGHNAGFGQVAVFMVAGVLAANITFTLGLLSSIFGWSGIGSS